QSQQVAQQQAQPQTQQSTQANQPQQAAQNQGQTQQSSQTNQPQRQPEAPLPLPDRQQPKIRAQSNQEAQVPRQRAPDPVIPQPPQQTRPAAQVQQTQSQSSAAQIQQHVANAIANQPNAVAGRTQVAQQVFIPETGQTVALPQLKSLPAGTQLTLRQNNTQQIDILRVQLPNSTSTATAQTIASNTPQTAQTAASAATTLNQLMNSATSLANDLSSKLNLNIKGLDAAINPSIKGTATFTPPVLDAKQTEALQQKIQLALKEAIPSQRPIGESLTQIRSLLPQLGPINQLPPATQQALDVLNKVPLQLSPNQTPASQQVKSTIERSGVFHEAMLMQAMQPALVGQPIQGIATNDLKGAFVQIFRHIARQGQDKDSTEGSKKTTARNERQSAENRSGQAQLMRAVMEGLARIRSNQLQSTNAGRGAETTAPALQTDIPISFNQQLSEVKLQMEHQVWPEEQNLQPGEEPKKRWVINLTFSPPSLGRLHARLFFQNEHLSSRIWVEQDNSLPEVSRHLGELRERLAYLGVVLEDVRCTIGKPDETKQLNSLVNFQA
ncbi:flagellar hook-length control protein FliK, partial [Oceanospirillum beijerinckii]|uniref:flagellar hook-length control protein FliK n=1 Tax=Oceanospirillum beijerinckii TaxID=64976 RepID=UPI00056D595E